MKCKVDGCDNDAVYKAKCVCQKHYFRFMRYGTYELTKKPPVGRLVTPNGYVKVYFPNHPLGSHNGYVLEHRKVAYEKYNGLIESCELCGKSITWETCHIDHIDNNRKNNLSENLRQLCRACNTFRDYPEQHTIKGRHSISFDGLTKTPEEWARDERVNVAGYVIRRRIASGMSVYDALFSPRKTHRRKEDYQRIEAEHKQLLKEMMK